MWFYNDKNYHYFQKQRSFSIMKFYYELRWPASKANDNKNCAHMTEDELLSDAIERLDNCLIDMMREDGDEEEAKLMEAYKTVLENKNADFEKIKLPILYDVYAEDDQELNRYDDPKMLHKEQDLDF